MTERELFEAALEETPDDRAAFLDRACAGKPELRLRLEALLARQEQAGSFLGGAALEGTSAAANWPNSASPLAEAAGQVLAGRYQLLEPIGEGGMGTVWLAQQTEPVRRQVAVKLIKAGMDSRMVLSRFEAQRQALALMDHPNIAKVLDGGSTDQGRPFFVMEYVKGAPITQYCDDARRSVPERLELFITVCQAVQHAHQKGVIHRDLKPSNLLICLYDGKPVAKVIDFGLAKAMHQPLTEHSLHTAPGLMLGTPLYMSPEQAALDNLDVDTRSDIYALGVVLYELLTGTTPLEKEQLQRVAWPELLRLIKETEPPKPSTRLSAARSAGRGARGVSAGASRSALRALRFQELDWIVMKALDKERGRRYETATGLARDLARYLGDEPVEASPPSAWYRFRKFTRRNKAALRIAAAAALVFLLAAGGLSWALWDQATRRQELSERMAETEQTVTAALLKTESWSQQAAEAPRATSQEADAVLALWRQAEASLAQAETALRTGTADDRLRQRVLDERQQIEQQRVQAQRTANLLRDLDDARMTRLIWIETHFDYAGSATKYAAAFAAYGLEVKPGRTEELARHIRAEQPAIREALIVALENWREAAVVAKTAELENRVRMIAAAADDDPWRRQHRAAATARDATALRALSGQARQLSLPPSSLELLATSLHYQGDRDEALALLRWARGRHLTDFGIHFQLGYLLQTSPLFGIGPDVRSTDISPVILEETIGCYRTALALRPAASFAHNNLGYALQDKNQLDEAMAEYRKAIDLDPKFAMPHNNLGNLLRANNQLDKAMAEYRKAIDLDPKLAMPHHNLGVTLYEKNQWDESMAEFRQAIKLDPKLALAHNHLGRVLQAKNQLEEAIAEYRQAIEANPKYTEPHYNLGNALRAKNQWDEAIAEYKKAINLQPDHAEAHCHLAYALRLKGQLSASLHFMERGHAFGSKRKDWRNPSAQWVADAERLVRLEAKLADVLAGKATPMDNRELRGLLEVCRLQRRYVAAARLYADAFNADPKLADDRKAGRRYIAACFAAMAAAGQGTGADKQDDQEHGRLRQQALAWLRADLELWSKSLDGSQPAERQATRHMLQRWQHSTDLAGVRDAEALKMLPAEEQEAWRELWADVAELLKKVDNAK